MAEPTTQLDEPAPGAACSYCGSREIIAGLKLAHHIEVGNVGIRFEATERFLGAFLTGNEPLLADLCQNCGSVVRLHVASTERRWLRN